MNLKNLLLGNITQADLLNHYNATIVYSNIPVRGFVDYYNDTYFIYINKELSYYKRKKTILHELAHIELNQLQQIDNADLFACKIDKYEDEADRYIKFILENL